MGLLQKVQNGGDNDLDMLSEINVTPFIDVMLVLLIIFMVVAPLSTVSIPLELPAGSQTAAVPPVDQIYISLRDDRSLYIGENLVNKDDFIDQVKLVTKGNNETRLFIRADKNVSYDDFVKLINVLRENAYLKVALVGLQPGAGT